MKERVTNIHELQKGDQVWTLKGEEVKILQLLQVHPHSPGFSIFLGQDEKPVVIPHASFQRNLQRCKFYRFTDSEECWNDIHLAQRNYCLNAAMLWDLRVKQDLLNPNMRETSCFVRDLTKRAENECGDGVDN